jgi:hypothetical protein
MVSKPSHPGKQAYDRWFLLGEKRDELLALWEVQQYGRDSFGDPDYVSIYGLKPHEWYARGCGYWAALRLSARGTSWPA